MSTTTDLDDIGKSIAEVSDGMGPLVAMRSTLIKGGFTVEVAEAIVLETIRSTLAQTLARIENGSEA